MTLRGPLLERLDTLAAGDPHRVLVTELMDGRNVSATVDAIGLQQRADAVAASLHAAGYRRGDVVLLVASSPVDFLVALLGCFRTGVIAAPIAVPRRPEHLQTRVEPVKVNSGACAVLAGRPQDDVERTMLERLAAGGLPVLRIDEPASSAAPAPAARPPSADDVAYLQYTSGSTSEPKGVVVTHGNLVANMACIAEGLQLDATSVIVSWNPLTHDMGLVMGALPAIAYGTPVVLMPPAAFIRRPVAWLEAIDRFRGTHGYSPNFGYDLLVDRTTPEQRAALDLSSMRVWLSAAEQVRLRTWERFRGAFGASGVRESACHSAWGLAEATVLVTATPVAGAAPVVWVDGAALEQRRVVIVDRDAPAAQPLCANGIPTTGFELCVVDPDTGAIAPPDRVGELYVRGPSVSPGYWQRPDETAGTFGARVAGDDRSWLRTGDLVFLHDGHVVMCGRSKDVIIIHGRNLYPHDIELTAVMAHERVRPGGTAAFSVQTDAGEAIAVLVEVDDPDDAVAGAEVKAAVRRAVLREFDVRVADIVLVGPRGVPKTSSGKVQRSASRDVYLVSAGGRSTR